MTKISFILAFAAVSMSFATASQAQEGTYYEGAQSQPRSTRDTAIDRYGYTGSIGQTQHRSKVFGNEKILNSGDYYEGANRPN